MPRAVPDTSPSQRFPFDPESVRAIVARTRADQGLPPTITDPAVIARLATMVASADILTTGPSRDNACGPGGTR